MPARKSKPSESAADTGDEKSGDQLRIRISETLKDQIKDALKDHPHFKGNVSQFVVECISTFVLQTRRGEKPLHPLEFVTK